jgi:hypothetical protein
MNKKTVIRISIAILVIAIITVASIEISRLIKYESNPALHAISRVLPANMSYVGSVTSTIPGATINIKILKSAGIFQIGSGKFSGSPLIGTNNSAGVLVFGPVSYEITENVSGKDCLFGHDDIHPQDGTPISGSSYQLVSLPANGGGGTYIVTCKNSSGSYDIGDTAFTQVLILNMSQFSKSK